MKRRMQHSVRFGLIVSVLLGVGATGLAAQIPDPTQPRINQDSVRASEIDRIIQRCTFKDNANVAADERLTCWEAATGAAPADFRALEGRQKAQRDLKDQEKSAISQAQTKSTRDSIEFLLARSREELARGSMDAADRYALDVLAKDLSNQRALDLREKISTARALQANKRLALSVIAAVTAFIAGVVIFVRWIRTIKPKGEESSRSGTPVAQSSRVTLRVVDGVGRGRMYTVEGDTYRIGAAESERIEEKNDLILSDSNGYISRFHCALLRRKKRWTIVDSSLHGTWVNDRQIERGAHVPLRDGDEIVIAGISRLTFFVM